jgi:hypothetical protein
MVAVWNIYLTNGGKKVNKPFTWNHLSVSQPIDWIKSEARNSKSLAQTWITNYTFICLRLSCFTLTNVSLIAVAPGRAETNSNDQKIKFKTI